MTSALPPLQELHSVGAVAQVLGSAIKELADRRGELKVLEAGCGRSWAIEVPGARLHITGVDLDEEALRARQEVERDLQDYVVGDLRNVDLPHERFDVVYSSYVLEHVSGAQEVLDRLVDTVVPGGLLLINIPDGHSVYGFLARITPFFLHVAYKKFLLGYRDAGKPGHGPYPTVYDDVISRIGMRRYCEQRDLTLRGEYGSTFYCDQFRLFRKPAKMALRAIAGCSRGALSAEHNNLTLIVEKPVASSAHPTG